MYERLPVGAREFRHNGIARQPDLGKPPKALIVPPLGSSIQLELYRSRSKVAMHVNDVLSTVYMGGAAQRVTAVAYSPEKCLPLTASDRSMRSPWGQVFNEKGVRSDC